MLTHLTLLGKAGVVNVIVAAIINILSGMNTTGSPGVAIADYLFAVVGVGTLVYALNKKMSSTAVFAISFIGWALFLLLELGFQTGIVPQAA